MKQKTILFQMWQSFDTCKKNVVLRKRATMVREITCLPKVFVNNTF